MLDYYSVIARAFLRWTWSTQVTRKSCTAVQKTPDKQKLVYAAIIVLAGSVSIGTCERQTPSMKKKKPAARIRSKKIAKEEISFGFCSSIGFPLKIEKLLRVVNVLFGGA